MRGVQRIGLSVIVVEKHIAFITSSHCWKNKEILHNKKTEIMGLIFYIGVILGNLLLFFLKWTAPTAFLELLLKVFGKLIPLFLIVVSIIQILATYGYLEKPLF
jgi:hypothetical protein